MKIVLTSPQSLDSGLKHEHGQKKHDDNIVSLVLGLFKSIQPGADIHRFQLPVVFNMPKSQLQLYGESVYCYSEDMLSKCSEGITALERFKAVVAWCISTTRPPSFGKAPYNPILGETHHASHGSLNVFLEQVSHHPPISALYATDEVKRIELNWWQSPKLSFNGRSVEATIHGKREMKLLDFGEVYEMNSPKLCIHFFPFPGMGWAGEVKIQCQQSGFTAILHFKGKSLLGLRGSATGISGSIMHHAQILYKLQGNWDQIVMATEIETGKKTILLDARRIITNLKTPVVKNPLGIGATESAVVWAEVSESILRKDWKRAAMAKRNVEEQQRNVQRCRPKDGMKWMPRYFTKLSHDDDVDSSSFWTFRLSSSSSSSCKSQQVSQSQFLPAAPIAVPQ